MKQIVLYILLVLFPVKGWLQDLPYDRFVDWSKAGLTITLPAIVNNIDFDEAGGIGDGEFSNVAVMDALIDLYGGEPTQINFGAGSYFFDDNITLPNNFVLSGIDANTTELKFDLDGATQDLIKVNGAATALQANAADDLEKGSSIIPLVSYEGFEIGDWIQLIDNDSLKITSSWAVGKTGQIAQIKELTDEGLLINQQLRRSYTVSEGTHVAKLNLKTGVGIQNLRILRLDETIGQASNISFRYTCNSFVKCVESTMTNFAHVKLEYATNCEITGSYFYEAHDYGNGGKGYGVVAQFATGECLVSNNNFEKLRHAMLLQAGANGNVYSYNYSTAPYWSGVGLPKNAAGDLVLHGNYVYANLFEGNVVQNVVIDDSHGKNGPFNTFFRNRAQYYGFFMNNSPATDQQNFIGNEITNSSILLGFYFFEGEDHYFYGNNHKGTTRPEGTDDLIVPSLYLDVAPTFYEFYESWPPIGYPNEMGEFSNQAVYNYLLDHRTHCESDLVNLNSSENMEVTKVRIYPNPAKNYAIINLTTNEVFLTIRIFEISGNEIYRELVNDNTVEVNFEQFQKGVYLVEITGQKAIYRTSLIKI